MGTRTTQEHHSPAPLRRSIGLFMKTVGQGLQHRRRERLPHWEKGGAAYFLTFSARRGEHFDAEERAIILASCRFGHPERWNLDAAVVMPDHVHMLLTPQRVKWVAGAGTRTTNTRTTQDKSTTQENSKSGPRWWSLAEIVKGIKVAGEGTRTTDQPVSRKKRRLGLAGRILRSCDSRSGRFRRGAQLSAPKSDQARTGASSP